MGYVDDEYWDTDDRHSDSGSAAYSENIKVNGFPQYMGTKDPGSNVDFLVDNVTTALAFDPFGTAVTHTKAVAIDFDTNAAFNSGGTIPGYVLTIPQGDRASVRAAGKYKNGVWTVEFKKPYSGGENDFTVVSGSSVDFTVEIFDNQGSDHGNDGFDATVYTLDFSSLSSTTPTPTPTPTPETCNANTLEVSPSKLELSKGQSDDVTVTVLCKDGSPVKDVKVKRMTSNKNSKKIDVSPSKASTDENGQATFTVTALRGAKKNGKSQKAKALFKAKVGLKAKLTVELTD